MSQVPGVSPDDPTFYLDEPVLIGGGSGAATVDTIQVATPSVSDATAQPSAVEYQSSVQSAIDAFITTLLNANAGNLNIVANVINNAVGSALIPSSAEVQSQYNSDSALINNAATLLTDYNTYLAGINTASTQNNIPASLTGSINDLGNLNTIINGNGSNFTSVSSQLASLQSQYNAAFLAGNYSLAQSLMNQATSLYDGLISGNYGTISSNVNSYNSAISSYISALPTLPGGFTQSAWNAAQSAIVARNNDTSLTQFFGTLVTLPNYPGVPNLSTLVTASAGGTPPTSSSFGFPSTISSGTDNSAVNSSFASMIGATETVQSTLQTALAATNFNGFNIVSALSAPGGYAVPQMIPFDKNPGDPSDTYYNNFLSLLTGFLTSQTFQELLKTLGIQSDAAAQALAALILQVIQGEPSILLTNPSGGAVTGATLSVTQNSTFEEQYAQALAKELLREVQSSETYKTPHGIRKGDAQASDPNANPSGMTSDADAVTEQDPGTSTPVGALGNIPVLTSDFAALIGQFSILAAISVLQSDSLSSGQDTAAGNSQFLSALSSFIQAFSTTDLDNRLQALFQAQGITLTNAELTAINTTVTQFLTTLQGLLNNTLAGDVNLSTASIGAQIAQAYVQSTQQDAQQSNKRLLQLSDQDLLNEQNIQTLLKNLPQTPYFSGASVLAQASAQGGGGSGSLEASLAALLPKDANGNYQSLTAQQLYADLVQIQGQQQGAATFVQFVQNEPQYQQDQITADENNRVHAGKLPRKLEGQQKSTIITNANKAFTDAFTKRTNLSNQTFFDAASSEGAELLNLINNPTLAKYYSKKLLPGRNLLNMGLQIKTDQQVNTPQSRNTTQFVV